MQSNQQVGIDYLLLLFIRKVAEKWNSFHGNMLHIKKKENDRILKCFVSNEPFQLQNAIRVSLYFTLNF